MRYKFVGIGNFLRNKFVGIEIIRYLCRRKYKRMLHTVRLEGKRETPKGDDRELRPSSFIRARLCIA